MGTELSAGRAFDCALARDLFGVEVRGDVFWRDLDVVPLMRVPDYSTEWNAAGSVLHFMAAHGSSLTLDWGEETAAWECAWVTGGTRFVGHGDTAMLAICRAAMEAMEGKR
jgi:hypothetical protein